jgi:hypothetical protein
MVWSLQALILEEINQVSKLKRHDPSVNSGRRTIGALLGALPRSIDPKSEITFSRD